MKLISALVVSAVISIVQSYECNHPNTAGLFPNIYTTSGYSVFNLIHEDSNNANGDEYVIPSANIEYNMSIFTYYGQDVKVYDIGIVAFDGVSVSLTANRFFQPDTPYLSPIVPPSGMTEYRFTVEHIKRSEEFDASGKAKGANICILERAEEMVNGCYRDDVRSYGEVTLEEVILVTWNFYDMADNYRVYMQALIANDGTGETFVLFVYDDISNDFTPQQWPHINGMYNASQTAEYAAVCDNENVTMLLDNTNCRCGSMRKGTYVFATRDNDDDESETYKKNACSLSQSDFDDLCMNPPVDNRQNYQPNCRPAMTPVDTCLDDVRCKMLDTVDNNNVELSVRLHDTWLNFIFVEVASFTPENPVLETDGQCRGALTDQGDEYSLYQIQINPSDQTCGTTFDGNELEFIIMTYNGTHEDSFNIVYAKTKFFHGICRPSDLPFMVSNTVDMNGVLGSTVGPNVYRPLELVLLKQREWVPAEAANLIFDGEIAYRRYAYLAIVYDYGTRNPRDDVEVYAAYPIDCWVSNNADFFDTGNLRTTKILENGCQMGSPSDPFYLEDEFEGLHLNSAQPSGEYNFVSAAGGFRAVWWFNSNRQIFLRCSVGTCLNQDYYYDSKCYRSCSNEFENFNQTRKRRSEDDEIILTTSITIVDPPVNAEVRKEEECVTNTVAISTLVALIVLLLLSMVITLLLFIKLQRRQKK